jgi:polyphosphate kinase
MLLVTRKEGNRLVRYAHLSTGNYNAKTAKLYTDISYLTANPQITFDIEQVFSQLASQTRLPKLHHLWVAPFNLHTKLRVAIDQVAKASMTGKPGRIILKMNSLTDQTLAADLVRAGQSGVQIVLIILVSCILPALKKGLTDNVRVRSIIGRFLEHSRVFYFRSGDKEDLYLSSADWMNRNMMRRIDIAWRVQDAKVRQRIVDECLVAYLHDTADAWLLDSDGSYHRQKISDKSLGLSAQSELMKLHQKAH